MIRLFRQLRARIRYRHFDDELTRELEVHRAMAQDELRAADVTDSEVRRLSARALGNTTRAPFCWSLRSRRLGQLRSSFSDRFCSGGGLEHPAVGSRL